MSSKVSTEEHEKVSFDTHDTVDIVNAQSCIRPKLPFHQELTAGRLFFKLSDWGCYLNPDTVFRYTAGDSCYIVTLWIYTTVQRFYYLNVKVIQQKAVG